MSRVELIFHECLPSRRERRGVCRGLRGVIRAHTPDEVMPALRAVERAADDGAACAGLVCYEAAAGIDPHLKVHPPAGLPLVWFGVFDAIDWAHSAAPAGPPPLAQWLPAIERTQYDAAVERIRQYISAGDTYQVNYTLPLRTAHIGDDRALFDHLCRAQRGLYNAYIDTGGQIVCSASPELFFELDGEHLTSRPMKGTARRGRWRDEDIAARDWLASSVKNRAENAMIVDMMRNDLGRVAIPGSVVVRDAFAVERYPTVWQMTTTVACRTGVGVAAIFEALFPCASVTGAPKIRTMEIIRELEPHPRGLYTGAIGYVLPGRRARFSVAIRTAVIDNTGGQATYGVGGGIVLDSTAPDEYAECLAKAAVLSVSAPDFELLETMLVEDGRCELLDGHLRRLAGSAEYFDFACDLPAVRGEVLARAAKVGPGRWRMRLRLDRLGEAKVEVAAAPPAGGRRTVRLARTPVDDSSVMLYHKTTWRQAYDAALAATGSADDVLLWNTRGELTETCIANVVAELDGELVTPPVSCGLLGGVLRERLLASGRVKEGIVHVDDIGRCRGLWAVSALRGWVQLDVVP
jgi:para-aminobenzoate synthetase/4-amino-4-deoxychorismate lyase